MIIRELPRCILCQQSLYVFVIKLYHLINRSIATKHVHSHYQINKNVTNEYQHRSKIKGELPKKSQLLKSQLKSIATGYRYHTYKNFHCLFPLYMPTHGHGYTSWPLYTIVDVRCTRVLLKSSVSATNIRACMTHYRLQQVPTQFVERHASRWTSSVSLQQRFI